jgi:D-galactose 1-dehydrogenase
MKDAAMSETNPPKPTLGLVGVGKIAIDQHIPSIAETGTFDLVAVVSQRGIAVPGARTFRTQAEMLAAMPQLDAVANCTPPHVRHAATLEALQAGKHVLIEKPPTASVAELADMQAAAMAAGKTLFATWHSQFNPAVDKAAALLKNRAPKSVTITWKEDVRRWHPGQEWIWQPGGFGVFDPGINALSILVKIMPAAVFVEKATLLFPQNRATPIAVSMVMRSPGAGVDHISAEFDWRQEGEQTWTIDIALQDGGTLTLTHGGTRLFIDGKAHISEADQEYRSIYRRFADLIRTGQSDVDARPLHIVADAMLMGALKHTAAFEW